MATQTCHKYIIKNKCDLFLMCHILRPIMQEFAAKNHTLYGFFLFIPNTIWLSQGITRPIDIYHTERNHISTVADSLNGTQQIQTILLDFNIENKFCRKIIRC